MRSPTKTHHLVAPLVKERLREAMVRLGEATNARMMTWMHPAPARPPSHDRATWQNSTPEEMPDSKFQRTKKVEDSYLMLAFTTNALQKDLSQDRQRPR